MKHGRRKRFAGWLMTLILVIGLAPAAVQAIGFPDVTGDAWYYRDVQKAVESGIINGYTDGTFGPEKNMTYAEAVKLAACMHQKHTKGEVTLQNGDPWYELYVSYAKAYNIISRNYRWDDYATRAGYAEIFAHALPENALAARNSISDNAIPDVSRDHPQAKEIYKLYRAGVLNGMDNTGIFDPNSCIKRSEVSAILTRMMDPSARKTVILNGPRVISQPKDVVIQKGESAVFSVSVTGGKEPYAYQWELTNGTPIEGYYYQGTKTDTLTVVDASMAFCNDRYYCIITDANGDRVDSDIATLIVQ